MKLSVNELANYLRVSRSTILNYAKKGHLPFLTIKMGERKDKLFDLKQVLKKLERK